MTWTNDRGVLRWDGTFPDPPDDELLDYGWLGNDTRCGTEAGYRKHKRAGEAACDKCKAGHARAVKARRENKEG